MDETTSSTTGRRNFLRLGGGGLLAAAVLVACSDDEPEVTPGETGQTIPPTATTEGPPQTTQPEQGREQDILVTRTARSMELTMVETYEALLGQGSGDLALPAGVTLTENVRATFEVLLDRHTTHAEELSDLIAEVGGDPVAEANAGVMGAMVLRQFPTLTDERLVLAFARSLEDLCASTYTWGAGTLSTPEHRQQMSSVAMVTARQPTLVAVTADPSGVAVVPTFRVDVSGPARVPVFMLVPVDGDGGDVPTEAPETGG